MATSAQARVALEHLASVDPIDLCNEVKIECCRATRDLRSCGLNVRSVLESCGHASLCEECSQRCDVCPICRTPLPQDEKKLRLRLYYECIEARLISKRNDDRLQEKDSSENHPLADIQRLYSLFDIALENNLVSLICHYVTDVCMDESAVSSDPVIAFLLDEVVVRDWCQRTFKNILTELQVIYSQREELMKESLNSLLKFSVKLAGISQVLEVLESSFKRSLSAKLSYLYPLQENISKTKQHMEILLWCIRHQFLENVRSRHADIACWCTHFRDRKSAAIKRAWPDSLNLVEESGGQNWSLLFIEDALSNIESEHADIDEEEELEIASLQKGGRSSFNQCKLKGMVGSYPFESLRAASDVLFLHGSSDLVVAKQAIFLYYLFDRYWTMPDDNWRYIVDDFAATFSITRHSLLESLTFYLLDDHSDEALEEACYLLPEIASPNVHPKVAQVLLERQNPDAALMLLRWSGKDGGAEVASLREALTAVRVRVECGLLTEAFMYQRTVCSKVKDKKSGDEKALVEAKDECWVWGQWVDALVTEICLLCIRRNLADRMIELPWNSDEEKYLHKCLLDYAMELSSSTIGSLLVVYYLQRHRYVEAYHVNHKLQEAEESFISKNSMSPEVLSRMKSTSHWRAGLVDKSMELLPDFLQQEVKSGKLPEVVSSTSEACHPAKRGASEVQEPILTSLLAPSSFDFSSVHQPRRTVTSLKPSAVETPSPENRPFNMPSFRFGSPVNANGERASKPENGLSKIFRSSEVSTPVNRHASLATLSPIGEFHKTASRVTDGRSNYVLERVDNGTVGPTHVSNSYSHKSAANPFTSSQGIFTDVSQDSHLNPSGKRGLSQRTVSHLVPPSEESLDILWSQEKDYPVDTNGNGPRWRSDDSSDDEYHLSSKIFTGVTSHSTHKRGSRRGRITRR